MPTLTVLPAILALQSPILPKWQPRSGNIVLQASPTIYAGASLPSAEVQTPSATADIREVLGKGRSILVGSADAREHTNPPQHAFSCAEL